MTPTPRRGMAEDMFRASASTVDGPDPVHDRDLDTTDYPRRVSNLQAAALQPELERLEGLERWLNSDSEFDLSKSIRDWLQQHVSQRSFCLLVTTLV